MGTRSSIAIKNEDGSVEGIYCHWDGYLSYNGNILFNHYKTEEKVRELISLGDLSALGEEINPNPDAPHDWSNKQERVCLYYHRDREEDWTDVKPTKAISEIDFYKGNGQEYDYIFIDGKWFWRKGKNNYVELTEINTM